jgi:hypothetical protein
MTVRQAASAIQQACHVNVTNFIGLSVALQENLLPAKRRKNDRQAASAIQRACHVNVTNLGVWMKQISSNLLLPDKKHKLKLIKNVHLKPSPAGLQFFWSLK